jgi:hypothetical protein
MMSDVKVCVIEEIIQNKRLFRAEELRIYAREPKAITPEFLTKKVSLLANNEREQKYVIDLLIFNDHFVQRMLSTEALFSRAEISDLYFKIFPVLANSIVGYMAKAMPNKFINAVNQHCDSPLNFLARPPYSGANTSLLDLVVSTDHLLNIQNVQELIVKSNPVIDGVLYYSTDFLKLFGHTPIPDVIASQNFKAIKEVFYSKTTEDMNSESFLVIYARSFISDPLDERKYMLALIDAGLDIQQLSVKDFFFNASVDTKRVLLNSLYSKLEALQNVFEINFEFLPDNDSSKTLLDKSIFLLNNSTAINGQAITDEANVDFNNFLNKMLEQVSSKNIDVEGVYSQRTDPGALYAIAYVVHLKTKKIFEEVLGDLSKDLHNPEPDL